MEIAGVFFAFIALWGTISCDGFFKFENCGSGNGENFWELGYVRIQPDPIDLKKNITIDLKLNVLRDLPENAILRVRYYKLKKILGMKMDVKIPCLLGKFGSCSFPLCEYLKKFNDQAAPLFPDGVEPTCPVKAGEYGGDNVEIQTPDVGMIARFIVGGKYRTEMELLVDGKITDCYKWWIQAK